MAAAAAPPCPFLSTLCLWEVGEMMTGLDLIRVPSHHMSHSVSGRGREEAYHLKLGANMSLDDYDDMMHGQTDRSRETLLGLHQTP